jgi:hypothetical protein
MGPKGANLFDSDISSVRHFLFIVLYIPTSQINLTGRNVVNVLPGHVKKKIRIAEAAKKRAITMSFCALTE